MASPNVSFETIPSSIRVPGRYIEFNTKLAVRNLPVNPQHVLIVAPMLASGTQKPLDPVMVFSDVEAGEKFGYGSWAHLMAQQAIRNNQYINLSISGLPDDPAAVKAVGKIEIEGSATREGQLILNIGKESLKIAATRSESAKELAERLTAVINANESVLVTAEAEDAGITLTAKNGGEIGNEIYLDGQSNAPGVTLKVGNMENGQGNADISEALAEVAGKRYHIYVSAFSDDENLARLNEHIEAVSNAIEKRGGIGVAGWSGTLAQGITKASKLNSGRMVLKWYKGSISGNALIAAGFAAVMASEEDPARPLNTLEIKGLDITPESEWPTFAEFNNALYNGLSPLQVVNNRVQIMRAITTYTKNATGTDDPALLDVTTIRTLDYTRDALDQRYALRFPREKLSDKTPPKVRSETLDVLMKLEDLEILEQVEENKSLLVVERDLQDANRLNLIIPADVVNGLHVLAARIDLYL